MLDRIHKIAEILAAVAIVFSLVFVGLQIKQNTRAIASQEDSSVWLPWLDLFQMTVSSSEFTDILVRGQSGGLDMLNEVEKHRFSDYLAALFVVYEQNFRARKRDPSLLAISTVRKPVDDAIKVDKTLVNKGSRE
jgi:hypothetical protein